MYNLNTNKRGLLFDRLTGIYHGPTTLLPKGPLVISTGTCLLMQHLLTDPCLLFQPKENGRVVCRTPFRCGLGIYNFYILLKIFSYIFIFIIIIYSY